MILNQNTSSVWHAKVDQTEVETFLVLLYLHTHLLAGNQEIEKATEKIHCNDKWDPSAPSSIHTQHTYTNKYIHTFLSDVSLLSSSQALAAACTFHFEFTDEWKKICSTWHPVLVLVVAEYVCVCVLKIPSHSCSHKTYFTHFKQWC